jgi:hypothetical protein
VQCLLVCCPLSAPLTKRNASDTRAPPPSAPRQYVLKRDGRHEPVLFDKITARIKKLCWGLNADYVDATLITQKVVQGVYPGVTTFELDELAAETCAYMSTQHPDFSTLAARISISNLHKKTEKIFSNNIETFHNYTHPKTGSPAPLIADDVYDFVMENKERLNGECPGGGGRCVENWEGARGGVCGRGGGGLR